jgi:hypothetical protein
VRETAYASSNEPDLRTLHESGDSRLWKSQEEFLVQQKKGNKSSRAEGRKNEHQHAATNSAEV